MQAESVAQLTGQLQNALVRARGMRDPSQDVALMLVRRIEDDPEREAATWRLQDE